MRPWLTILLVSAFAFSGCGSSPEGDETTPARKTGKADDGKAAGKDGERHGSEAIKGEADPDPVSAKGKSWDGWQWKGKRDDCFFVVGKRCFDDLDRACKAARCAKQGKKCRTRGGGPATIVCK